MKKLISLLLAAMMLLSMAACAGTADHSSTTNPAGGTTLPTDGNGGNGSTTLPTGSNGGDSGSDSGSGDSNGNGTQNVHTIEQFMKEALEMEHCGKTEYVKGSLPQDVWDWYEHECDLTYDAAIEAYETYQAGLQEHNQQDFGDNYHITFTIDETHALLNGITTERIATALAECYNTVDASKVTDTKYLVITSTQSGDKDSFTGTFAFTVVQYDGRWYALVYTVNAYGQLFANFSSTAMR